MSTPSIQTLITQAQQVLNLKSSNEIRATLAAILANANVGTPLNPNLTTQQLWDEFYEIVRQPSDDIMSIITDQMMRMVFSPPAPGGAGADKQVIFNDAGVLAGDAGLVYNKTTDTLTAGSATITGDLTVDTSTLKVDSTNDRVGIATATPGVRVDIVSDSNTSLAPVLRVNSNNVAVNTSLAYDGLIGSATLTIQSGTSSPIVFNTNNVNERYRIASDGVATWSNVGGVAGTAMTLNSTGLGIGVAPQAKLHAYTLNPTDGVVQLLQNLSTSGQTGAKTKYEVANVGASGIGTPNGTTNALAFFVGGITSAEERARIDASGNLLVGKTGSNGTVGAGTINEPAGPIWSTLTASTSAANTLLVYSTGAAAYRFYVGLGGTVNATNATISAISDARLKENVQDLDVGLDAILALKPRKFDWKEGKGKNIKGDRGFIAQEFETVFPNLIDEWKDSAPEGEAPYKSVRQDLIPVLVKAIQELTARVQTLEAR